MRIHIASALVLLTALGVGLAAREGFASRTLHPALAPVLAGIQDPLAPMQQHAFLQRHAGTWDCVVITQGPTGAEERTPGKMTTVKQGQYHTVESFETKFMGQPFVGHGINGYCPIKKKFYTLWTDTMTPSPLLLWGDYDEKKKELSMTGEAFGMSGTLEPCRTVYQFVDDDHAKWAMFGNGPDGKEVKMLSIEYTRKR